MQVPEPIREFLQQERLALVGVSRRPRSFGNTLFRELRSRGVDLLPVHRTMAEFDGTPCYRSLRDLPQKPGGVILVVHPKETEALVQEASEAGIPRVWMQQGSQSEEAIRFCKAHGIAVISGTCVLMFAEPVTSIHRLHRWLAHLFGRSPARLDPPEPGD